MRKTLASIVGCALLAACTKVGTTGASSTAGGSAQTMRHSWTQAHVLRIGSQVAPNTLNALLASNTTENAIDRFMFDDLVSIDGSGRHQVPILARIVPTLENGGISRDGLTITYHLRKGVVWQDGVPLTSKDVKFTWSAVLNPNNNVITQTGYKLVSSVDTPDDWTVVFHMKQKFSPVVDTLFGESDSPYNVLPEHLLGKLHDINTIAFNANPVGSGPFKVKEWVRGDHLTLVPNLKYFLGVPKLQQIVIKFIPDENTELNALRTHDIDWQFEASPQEYRELKNIADLKIVLQNRNEIERIQMNTKRPPLDDVRVRRAIAYAIDAKKLVDTLTFGSAGVADQDLPPFMWAHQENVTRYAVDRERSKALLAAAGWKPGADGDVVKNGKKLTLEIAYNASNATRRAAVVQVQAMLKAVGIDVAVKSYQGALLFATMGQGGVLQNGRYDLAWTGWVAGIDPDQSSLFVCDAQPPHGNNETHYCNPELDAAEAAALTHFDRPTRDRAYGRIEVLLTRDVPQLSVWWPRQIQPINPDFVNFSPNPVTESWNAYTWDI
ncbi:MAG: peptide ABC transporter substrate-binding protein [Candidatus Eremiobacteraeota bacterium]|nr:peptide ABC transporter substrate-binding protein [Candidatus Eremiobacteraeota bacterium]